MRTARCVRQAIAALALALLAGGTVAGPRVLGVHYFRLAERSELAFDLSGPATRPRLVPSLKPDLITLEMPGAALAGALPGAPRNDPLIGSVRALPSPPDTLRLAIALKSPARAAIHNTSTGAGTRRLVLSLTQDAPRTALSVPRRAAGRTLQQPQPAAPAPRPFVVAIDAGHGGDDPGAHGPSGLNEKDITLAIAHKLAALVRRQPGMRAVLTRDGDRYVSLRERIQRAREHKADLLVSIHADAFLNASARGSSVFTLSENGASSEAAHWLADKENRADLAGGVRLNGRDDVLASVLLDLSQTATRAASQEVAGHVLGELGRNGALHHRDVQHAGFVVLKAPDIPSLLVETAFISNPEEERKLRSSAHQERIARAVFHGIRNHFALRATPGTRLALR